MLHPEKKPWINILWEVFWDKNVRGEIFDGPSAWRYDGGYGKTSYHGLRGV
jgi:hypothetical protein